jgi:hypothetical protein
MSKKVRLKEVTVDGFLFPNHEGLIWHSGSFWFGDRELKRVCNNGSLAVDFFGSKLGVKKLRKQARRCRVKIEEERLPI